MYIVEEFL